MVTATTELENNNNNPEQYLVLTDAIINVKKVEDLKNALGSSNLNKGGLKAVLIPRLKQAVSNGMTVVAYIYPAVLANMDGDNFEPSAHWEILTPDGNSIIRYELDDSGGCQFHATIASGAAREEDPTAHAEKHNYEEEFYRPPFIQYVKIPKFTRGNRLARDANGDIIYEEVSPTESSPNIDYLLQKKIHVNSHPADWFNVFMSKHSKRQSHPDEVSIADFTSWTNKKMIFMNAVQGGVVYLNCVPFTVGEVMKHIGLYIFHGVVPSPQVEMKFQSTKKMKLMVVTSSMKPLAQERRRGTDNSKLFLPL